MTTEFLVFMTVSLFLIYLTAQAYIQQLYSYQNISVSLIAILRFRISDTKN